MNKFLPESIRKLIEEFSRLPGIGPKSAQRIVMFLLHSPEIRSKNLGESIAKFKEGLQFCRDCFNISESEICVICSDGGRDKDLICVVEEILDVMALEKSSKYKGVYHVLHGVISPVDGVGPEQLKIDDLARRVRDLDSSKVELIIATNPSVEGETTALYLHRLFNNSGIKMTRIARGLPIGGDLDYADEVTLMKAMEGRREM